MPREDEEREGAAVVPGGDGGTGTAAAGNDAEGEGAGSVALRATVALYLSSPVRRALELVVGELADLHLDQGVRDLTTGLPVAEVRAVVDDLRAAREQLARVAGYAAHTSLDAAEVQAVAAAGRALEGLGGVIERLEEACGG